MAQFRDLSGMTFGRLTAFRYIPRREKNRQRSYWLCICECGKEVIIPGANLTSGHTKSCGCFNSEVTTARNRARTEVNPKSRTRLYDVWKSIKHRCNRPHDKSYKNYGGRGIKLCEEWEHNFDAFRKWAEANGYDHDAPFGECTIDRIDNDKGYSPDNCRWVSIREQQKNKRTAEEAPLMVSQNHRINKPKKQG